MQNTVITRLSRARDMLCEVHDGRFTVADAAREAAMSPYHFIRMFKAVFGETPHQVRIDARLERARQLLVLQEHSDYRNLQRRRVLEPRHLQPFVCTPGGCLPFRIQTPRTSPRAGAGNAAARLYPGLLLADVRMACESRNFREARGASLTRCSPFHDDESTRAWA